MNRMTFALEELGYELVQVDTDNGTIVVRRWPAQADSGASSAFRSRRPYELVIQFPGDPELPITIAEIRPEPPLFGLGERELQRIVDEIAVKFRQFGGVVKEVTKQD